MLHSQANNYSRLQASSLKIYRAERGSLQTLVSLCVDLQQVVSLVRNDEQLDMLDALEPTILS